MSAAADLTVLAEAFGVVDGQAVANHWRAACRHHPAIAAHLRALADAPTPAERPMDPLQLAHQAGSRDLALTLLRIMGADALDIETIFNTTGEPYE